MGGGGAGSGRVEVGAVPLYAKRYGIVESVSPRSIPGGGVGHNMSRESIGACIDWGSTYCRYCASPRAVIVTESETY